MPHLALELPEIVSSIVSFLFRPNIDDLSEKSSNKNEAYYCLFVNRLFNDCTTRLLYRKVAFTDTKYNSFLKFTDTIISSTSFESLKRSDPYFYNDCFHEARNKLYRNTVKHLSLYKIKEKTINDTLIHLSTHCKNIERLTIYICDYFQTATLYRFLTNHSLIYLSLAGCHRITDDAISTLSELCPFLEHLDLRACSKVTDKSLCKIALHCNRLKHLNVGRVRDGDQVTSKSIKLIAKHTQVTVLGLAGCDIDDDCLELVAKIRHVYLERVSANSCVKISNRSLYALIEYCVNLSVFEMRECHAITNWEAVRQLVKRQVLLTLCEKQIKACEKYVELTGNRIEVKPPLK